MADQAKRGWYAPTPDAEWWRWWSGSEWTNFHWPRRPPTRPYLPNATRFDISTVGEPSSDVVGENWREAEILAALGDHTDAVDTEFVTHGVAELVPEPDNPHDANAVSVRWKGQVVGYLPSEQARRYVRVLNRFVANAVVPTVRLRLWGVWRWSSARNRREFKASIRIALPATDTILPGNSVPTAAHYVIPEGRAVKVKLGQNSIPVLSGYLGRRVIATLHRPDGSAGRRELDVAIDDKIVGSITRLTSAKLEPLLAEAESRCSTTAAWATIRGSRLAVEMSLRVRSAAEIPEDWPSPAYRLPTLGPADTAPPAYSPQFTVTAPPLASGLPQWVWISVAVIAALLLSIPYVGWLLAAVAAGGALWGHFALLKRVPSRRYTFPAQGVQ